MVTRGGGWAARENRVRGRRRSEWTKARPTSASASATAARHRMHPRARPTDRHLTTARAPAGAAPPNRPASSSRTCQRRRSRGAKRNEGWRSIWRRFPGHYNALGLARPSFATDDPDGDVAPARVVDRVLGAATAVGEGDHVAVRDLGEPVEHLDVASVTRRAAVAIAARGRPRRPGPCHGRMPRPGDRRRAHRPRSPPVARPRTAPRPARAARAPRPRCSSRASRTAASPRPWRPPCSVDAA